jgi:large subunit ribosomal protein L5
MRVRPVSPSKAAAGGPAKKAGKQSAPQKSGGGQKQATSRKAVAKAAGNEGDAPVARKKKPSGPVERPRLKLRYDSEVRAQLVEALGLANVMEAPRLEKIVVNMGVGRATQQPSLIEGAVRDLETITGQKPLVTRARRSIAGFKLREGMNIGVKVTMRGDRAWEFLDRLIALAIPRIRDFRGLSPKSFDGHGNYTFGVNEQLIFPEVDYDRVDSTRGMDITICTTARSDEHGRAFLMAFGFPFRQEAA